LRGCVLLGILLHFYIDLLQDLGLSKGSSHLVLPLIGAELLAIAVDEIQVKVSQAVAEGEQPLLQGRDFGFDNGKVRELVSRSRVELHLLVGGQGLQLAVDLDGELLELVVGQVLACPTGFLRFQGMGHDLVQSEDSLHLFLLKLLDMKLKIRNFDRVIIVFIWSNVNARVSQLLDDSTDLSLVNNLANGCIWAFAFCVILDVEVQILEGIPPVNLIKKEQAAHLIRLELLVDIHTR